jgi:2'-5' RNA ligase
MKLSKIFNKMINEDKGNDYSYGCVMLYLDIDGEWWNKLQAEIPDEDIFHGTEGDEGYGREDEPHVTILYGIHDDVSDEEVEARIEKMTAPEVTLKTIGMFDNEDRGFDVIKFDVQGEDLHKMNAMFSELPNSNAYPDYHPHATIAYVKAGKGDDYTRVLPEEDELTLKPNKIVYSKPDGSKKEYKFND